MQHVGAGTCVSGPLAWGARREYKLVCTDSIPFYTVFHVAALLRNRDQIEDFMYGIVFLTERASDDGVVG